VPTLTTRKDPNSLESIRTGLGPAIRKLRVAKHWSLANLSKRLELSLSRLSEIERGQGSFTAEQLVVMLKLFNVTIAELVGADGSRDEQLYLALANLGATHLREPQTRASESFRSANDAIVETLLAGDGRLIPALGPLLVKQPFSLNGPLSTLTSLGYAHRLAWLVDNVLASTQTFLQTQAMTSASLRLQQFQTFSGRAINKPSVVDVLDQTIRSARTLERVIQNGSVHSKHWNIATSITVEDFSESFRSSDD
jgi:transcriptional regulator with XRE-family HTH domain